MTGMVNVWTEALFRWVHVLAGIMWIGHLWFFNFVNSQLVKTYDADSKKKVLPELMPRALFWFRWGAAFTWITGFGLLALVYYMRAGGMGHEGTSFTDMTGTIISIVAILVIFFIYDAFWKMVKNEMVAGAISFVAIVGLAYGLSVVFTGRAMFIHMGALFGTIMAMNVWMRIWPAQKKIIGGVKGTNPAPDAAVAAMAGLRSKHNTYLSVPLVFFMISNHYSDIFTNDFNWAIASAFVLVGWGMTKRLYVLSGSAATAWFGAPAGAAAAPAAPPPAAK
jgi:uncharacterized membrane protein